MKIEKLLLALLAFVLLPNFANAEGGYLKLNYGAATSTQNVSAVTGSITTDSDDAGMMLSAGSMIGNNWGIDFMYYDLGVNSFKVTRNKKVKINDVTFWVDTAGTIQRETSGYGAGLIFATDSESTGLFSLDSYLKIGAHAWDKSGSTTLLDNDTGFSGYYYNQGIGGYGGIGVALGMFNNLSLDVAYDIIGISNDLSFDNNSTLLSAGFRYKF